MASLIVFQPGYRLNDDADLNFNYALLSGGAGLTFTDTITAHAGGTRALAVPLTVINAGASAMQLFAAVGTSDTINGVAAATGISVAAGKTIELVSFVGAWHGILSA